MPRAVRFDEYGPVEVLKVVEVPRPSPGPGQVMVEVVASGINPGEAMIRSGGLQDRWPSIFPSGQGSDLAGRVSEVGQGVTAFSAGDEVLGFTDERAAHAEFVLVEAVNLTAKPAGVSWERAGALFVAGTTAFAAVRAVELKPGQTVAVSGAAGGVGSLVVQLARREGARVIGIAGSGNADWLRSKGVEPVTYGEGLADRLRDAAPDGLDAFIDTFGGGYVETALELGVPADRVDTIIDFAAAEKYGVQSAGNADAASADVLAKLAGLIDAGELDLPVAATYPLEQVREAFTELADRHTRGKIVLRIS